MVEFQLKAVINKTEFLPVEVSSLAEFHLNHKNKNISETHMSTL